MGVLYMKCVLFFVVFCLFVRRMKGQNTSAILDHGNSPIAESPPADGVLVNYVLQGPAGRDGRDGRDGRVVEGPIGPPGLRGQTGANGSIGQPGQTGARGPSGPPGSPGVGQQGQAGARGPSGPPGSPGVGQQGQTGERGPPGPSGSPGVGQQGQAGASGPSGPPGSPGVGQQGQTGERGPPGPPGSPAPQTPGTSGTVFTRWGRTECPTTAELVYEGYVGGGWYGESGGAANYLCLPYDPTFLQVQPGTSSYRNGLFSAEYQTSDFPPLAHLHNHDVPCSVCRVINRGTLMMIPAKRACPTGWTNEYNGYLMAERYNHAHQSEYICVDANAEARRGTQADTDGALLYPVEANCSLGTLPCVPDINGHELACVVCTI